VATMITSGSRGTDDPTMATLPFMAAKTAKEQGHDVILWLWNESVTLGRKGTADHVTGTPLKELLPAVKAPVFRSGSAAPAHSPADRAERPGVRRHDQGHAGLYQSGGGT